MKKSGCSRRLGASGKLAESHIFLDEAQLFKCLGDLRTQNQEVVGAIACDSRSAAKIEIFELAQKDLANRARRPFKELMMTGSQRSFVYFGALLALAATSACSSDGSDGGGGVAGSAHAGSGASGAPGAGNGGSAQAGALGVSGGGANSAGAAGSAAGSATGGAGGASGSGGAAGAGGSGGASAGFGGTSAGSGGVSAGSGGAGGGSTAGAGGASAGAAGAGNAPTFMQVSSLLSTACGTAACHGSGSPHLDLTSANGLHTRLTTANTVDHCKGQKMVVASDTMNSFLVQVIQKRASCTNNNGTEMIARMPDDCSTTGTNNPCLSPTQIKLISDWVMAGALP